MTEKLVIKDLTPNTHLKLKAQKDYEKDGLI
jgi:hypothetical protein